MSTEKPKSSRSVSRSPGDPRNNETKGIAPALTRSQEIHPGFGGWRYATDDESDPVFIDGDGGFNFWDETAGWGGGPYETEEEARAALKKYGEWLTQ